MSAIFETFQPKDPTVARYVDYYYLDIKPENEITEFECFPHYNNTISLYASHRRSGKGTVYREAGKPLQIFTPVRERVLNVRQIGKVHRVVIVFRVLGIQHFFRKLDYTKKTSAIAFFTQEELDSLFSTSQTATITSCLDQYLLKRYMAFNHPILKQSIAHIFQNFEHFSVTELAASLQVSRRHLNRLFRQHLGVSIKKFQKIVCFRKAVARKLFVDPQESLTALAYEFNYCDQAHLIKTFGHFTQYAPRQFFEQGTLLGQRDTFWHLIR